MPSFYLRLFIFFRTALSRQIVEAVRIQRWGEDVVLNSRSEYNRCKIGRLMLETHEDKSKKDKNQLNMEEVEQRGEKDGTQEWESDRSRNRRILECRETMGRGLVRSPGRKRQGLGKEEQMSGKKRSKKWKHPVLDSW